MAGSKPAATLGSNGPSAQPSPEQVRTQMERILASPLFVRSQRLCRFLRFTVDLALSGKTDRIKEYTLGLDVFDRNKNYDPRADSIVRVEARRLRKKLSEYYQEPGSLDPVSIEFPPGSYVPVFQLKLPAAPRATTPMPLPEHRPLNPLTVAVLPFRNLSADPDQDFFCEGIAEEILNTLTAVPQLNVVARTSVFRFKGSHDVREIGRQLHAGTVIEGSVRKGGDRLRISVQAIDAIKGILLWSDTFDRELTDVFAVQDEIALAIADSLHVTLAAHAHPLPSGGGRQPALEAYTLLLKGRHFWNQVSQTGMQAALQEFTRAISLYPDYAPPYAALADAYLKTTFWGVIPPREGISKARQAALEAIRLDPNLADAYAFLGISACLYDWNWQQGSRLLRKAIELQPSNMQALSYAALQHVFRGEFDQARICVEKCSELDPMSPWNFRNQSWYYYYQRQYGPAAEAMQRALALDPEFREGQFSLAYSYLRQGRYPEAISLLQQLPEGPYNAAKWGALGEAYAGSGNTAAAYDALNKIDALAHTEYVSPISRASIYAGLRDWERVFQQLEQAYLEQTPWLTSLKVDPRYDPIRSDSRFASLLKRINLL